MDVAALACEVRRILRQHHDLGADVDAAEQIGDVFIGQANAAAGNELADRRGIVGAVNAVVAGAQIHRARAQRIAGTARHEAREIRLARDHLGRRMPIRPCGLARDGLRAGPGEALAADADAIANGAALAEHVIERRVAGIDNDGTGRLVGIEANHGALQSRGDRTGAAIAIIAQRGLGHHVVRRKCTLRRGRVAECLRTRLACEKRRGQQNPAENKRVCGALRWAAYACQFLCHGPPRGMKRIVVMLCTTNTIGTLRFRRESVLAYFCQEATFHVSAMELLDSARVGIETSVRFARQPAFGNACTGRASCVSFPMSVDVPGSQAARRWRTTDPNCRR